MSLADFFCYFISQIKSWKTAELGCSNIKSDCLGTWFQAASGTIGYFQVCAIIGNQNYV